MKKQLMTILGVCSILMASFTANAADGDTGTESYLIGETAETITPGVGSSIGVVTITDNGRNRSAHLVVAGEVNGVLYKWDGSISLDDEVTLSNDNSSISVELDTCSYPGHGYGGCGYVNFTVESNMRAPGLIVEGTSTVDHGLYYVRYAGSYRKLLSTSSGTIIGVPVNNSSDASIIKGQDVEIELVTKP